jgi:hypothetical protein
VGLRFSKFLANVRGGRFFFWRPLAGHALAVPKGRRPVGFLTHFRGPTVCHIGACAFKGRARAARRGRMPAVGRRPRSRSRSGGRGGAPTAVVNATCQQAEALAFFARWDQTSHYAGGGGGGGGHSGVGIAAGPQVVAGGFLARWGTPPPDAAPAPPPPPPPQPLKLLAEPVAHSQLLTCSMRTTKTYTIATRTTAV